MFNALNFFCCNNNFTKRLQELITSISTNFQAIYNMHIYVYDIVCEYHVVLGLQNI